MVSNTNSEYNDNKLVWERNRDCYLGQKKIKEGTTKYLIPKSYHLAAGMNDGQEGYNEYLNYASRAIFFNGVYRTVTTMQGLIHRKPSMVSGDPKLIAPYKKDFTIDNESMNKAEKELTKETILQGRAGLLVDYPDVNTSNMTQQELEDNSIHSYAAIYKAEDIINWKIEKRKGKMVPTLVVLKELVDAPWGSKFDTLQVHQYRVLELDERGYYKQTVYYLENPVDIYKKDPLSEAYIGGEYYPKMNGEFMDFIPFICIGVEGLSWDISRSPMEDITNINIGLYNNSADLENSLSITAAPTLILKGYESKEGQKVVLGSNNAIILNNIDGEASFLEFAGSGVEPTAKEIETKKKDMAILGLRILSAEQNINEGADTAAINQNGENSVLASISRSVSEALTQALILMVKWDNPDAKTDDIEVKLNTDFLANHLNANMLNSLTVMVKSGLISDEEMFEILKSGEIIPASMLFDEHKKQLAGSMFAQLMEGGDIDQDFNSPVSMERLTNPESPGDPNAKTTLKANAGGSQRNQ